MDQRPTTKSAGPAMEHQLDRQEPETNGFQGKEQARYNLGLPGGDGFG